MALRILKWVGITIGILLVLAILFFTWFCLETNGTFMRMREQPKLMSELKEMYGDKSLYVEEYKSNSDGIFSVGSFDYTIKSDSNWSIKFVVEYEPSFAIPIGDSGKSIEGMDIVRMIYKSSNQSAKKLYSIQDALAYEYVKVFPEIITIDDLEYSNTVTEEYDYGAVACYVYRIVVNNEVEKGHIINKIDEVLTEKGIEEYQINLMFVEPTEFENLLNSLKYSIEMPKQNSFFSRKKVNKDINFYNYYNDIITSSENYKLVKKAGHYYVEINGDEFDVDTFIDGSYKDYYYKDRGNYINNEYKPQRTFKEKMDKMCERVITTELSNYFEDVFTVYNTPFHIDENTYGDLEYRLYSNNKGSRFQVVMERKLEEEETILELRQDYKINFALSEANREIDKLILKELPNITILPDYISGCVEEEIEDNVLLEKEYLKNPIAFQNKYGTDNSVARWLFPVDYDKKKAVSEAVEVLENLDLDRYGVELVFVDDKMKEMLIKDFESFEIDESELFSLMQNGNNLYLMKDMNNITISYEDVILDERVIKDLDSFMSEYVDNSIPYKHREEPELVVGNDLEQELDSEEELVITLD